MDAPRTAPAPAPSAAAAAAAASASRGLRLLLLADTHLPRRARELPEEVWEQVAAADVVVHAGDWVDLATLEALTARARRLVAVAGNNDGPELHARLPLLARCELEGVRVAVVHETGAASGRGARCPALVPDADLLVFGHSHIPWDSTTTRPDGGALRLLNPGSPTDRRRQPRATYLTLRLTAGAVHDVELHALPLRAPHRPARPPQAPRPPRPGGGSSAGGGRPGTWQTPLA